MSAVRTPFALILCGLMSGCAFALINATSSDAHIIKTADIIYGSLPRQSLDIYQSDQISPNKPLVVFFYGGRWTGGSRKDYQFVAGSLTRAGYVVAIPDYRIYPEVTFPDFVVDAANAIAWIALHADEYNVDPKQIFLMGHSAGAHIAAMLALDQHYLDEAGFWSGQIAGLIGLSGPYDFLPLKEDYLTDVFPPQSREHSQPINFASARAPWTLLIHGMDDDVVSVSNSEVLAAKLQNFGVPVTLKIYPDRGHASIAVALATQLDFIAGTIDDVVGFIDEVSGSSNEVRIAMPLVHATVRDSFVLKGVARGSWFFEAELPLQIIAKNGEVLLDSFVSATGSWLTTGFVEFEKTVELPPVSQLMSAELVIRRNNPSDLRQNDREHRLPITLAP